MRRPPEAVVRAARGVLSRTMARSRLARRAAEIAVNELERAIDGVYGGSYFGEGRDPTTRAGLSGYERYDRATSNADVSAYLVWRWLAPANHLDIGCATGYLVEALAELGIDSHGVDVSSYAIRHSTAGARGRLRRGDVLEGLPFGDGSFEVVTVLETLEHLPPDKVPAALREVRRVCGGWVVATIPSFGPNQYGPGGWFEGKVRDDRVEHYRSLGEGYQGPVPYEDLLRDASGQPIEGHLTIASFSWWTERFAEAGLIREPVVEWRMHPDLARFGLTKAWNLYVCRLADTSIPKEQAQPPEQIAELEARWRLNERPHDPADFETVARTIGVR